MATTETVPVLVPVDMERGEKSDHPDFNTDDYYLARWGGEWYVGHFVRVWFGWHFACGYGVSGGFQFNTPGYNHSRWEALYRLEEVS